LVGQTYDGASVMAGELNGLQSKIRSIAPQAQFTHCYAHRLNLILQDASGKIKECRIFFANVAGFSSFFSKSTKRTQLLDDMSCARLPSNSDTRWSFKSRIIKTILNQKDTLFRVFDKIINSDNFARDHDSIREAVGFKRLLNEFNFLFLLKVFNLIFEQTDTVYNIVQNKIMDIVYCQTRINNLVLTLKQFRSDEYFKNIYQETNDMVDVEHLRKKRNTGTMPESNEATKFKRLFFEILDLAINQIELRFSNMNKLRIFDLLNKSKFETFKKSFPHELLNLLLIDHPNLFDKTKLETELKVLYCDPEIISESEKLGDMFAFIFSLSLVTDLPETYKLLSLVLSLPATSASVERSFSTLKRIKNFVRNSMSQVRLSNLATLSIENDLIQSLKIGMEPSRRPGQVTYPTSI
jgi:hypothetical protein